MGFRTLFNHDDTRDFCSQIGLFAENLEHELNQLDTAWQNLESTWRDSHYSEFAPKIENLKADYQTSLYDLRESHYGVLGTKLRTQEKIRVLGALFKQAIASMEILPVVTGVGSAILANQFSTFIADTRSQQDTAFVKEEPKTCDIPADSYSADNTNKSQQDVDAQAAQERKQSEADLVKKAHETYENLGDWADQKRKKAEDDANGDAFESAKGDDVKGDGQPSI